MYEETSAILRCGRWVAIALLATTLILVLWAGRPPAAAAGVPGAWTAISGDTGSLLATPAVARDSGGTLQVAWITFGTPQSLKYRSIAASGTPGTARTLDSGWSSLGNPAIVPGTGGQLLVFAGGIRTGDARDGLNWWSSSDDGGSFTLQPNVLSGPGGTAYQGDMRAVATPSSVFQTWCSTYGVYIHRGLTSGTDYNVNDVGDFGYHSSFAYDATSDRLLVLAAYNATDSEGLWARLVNQTTGAAAAPSFLLAKSATTYHGSGAFDMQQMPVPATGLMGRAGVVVAYPAGYPSATTMRVWRIMPGGTTTSALATGGSAKAATAVAADSAGRAWVVWATQSGSPRHVYARRSNVGATAWGRTVSLKGPAGSDDLWELAASAQSGRLDIVGLFTKGSAEILYHTQLRPGLDVAVSPAKASVGRGFTAKVTVKDAGVVLAGAKVAIAGRSATTDSSGVAKVKVAARKSAGTLAVTVTRSGYVKGTASIRIVR